MHDSAQRAPDSANEDPTRWFGSVFIALLPVLACFLGGATQKWGEGIIVTLLGIYLLARPPRLSLGLATNVVIFLLVVLAAVAFLPAKWFFHPHWRSAFVNDFDIALPSAVSPQPWITFSCMLSFVAGLSWLYVVCAQELELREARFQIRAFTSGMVFLAALCIGLYLAHNAFPFWHNAQNFGPFPDRNQTGNLFGLIAIMVLACGQDDLRKGRKRWLVWLAALGVVIAVIIINFSRAGIGILVAGSALWLGLFSLRQRSQSRIALGVSFLLLLLTALLLFGGQTLERFHLRNIGDAGLSTDFRWRIFRDVFQLIHDSPWCGIGLGNFDSVFAVFRTASIAEGRALHPESDWLWMWAELGWVAVLVTSAGIVLIIRLAWPLWEGTNQRYRLAALIAALLFALHGIVDVSGHGVGTALSGLFLLGLALHRPLLLKPTVWLPIVFRLVGLVLAVAGGVWVVAARNQMLLPASIGVSNAEELATVANRERDYPETIKLTTRALDWAPLDWNLYFSRALAEVPLKQTANAITDFRRARFLEPTSYEVPLAEGEAWLKSQPVFTLTAWREALRRAGTRRAGVYSMILGDAALRSPEVRRGLEELGVNDHELALPYLGATSGSAFSHALSGVLKNDPNLQSFSDTEKLVFFALWSERGDPEALAGATAQHPDWLPYAWLGVAKYDASKQDFHAAYTLTQRYGDPVALPRVSNNATVEELEKRYHAAPDNYAIGYGLFRAQMRNSRIDDALMTARHFSERAGSPRYFHFLEAECWAQKQNWERAWNAWLAFHSAQTAGTK